MRSLFVIVLAGLIVLPMSADKRVKLKIPHIHKAQHDGTVYMLGDSHFEAVVSPSMLMIYASDKFGDPVAFSEFKVFAYLVNKEEKIELKFDTDKKVSNLIHVMLPSGLNLKSYSVHLSAKKLSPQKGELVLDKPVIISLQNMGAEDAHSHH